MAGDRLISKTPTRVLAVYAHPDDPDISCGGSIARWARDGAQVSVAICAAGDKGSHDPEQDPEELVRCRAEEAHRATKLLGVSELHMLGHRDGELDNDTHLRCQLVSLMRAQRPEVVVCPDPTAVFFGAHHYNHRDHRVVGWATLDAAAPASGSPLYFPQAGPVHQVREILLSGSLEADS
ncbi:MAG: PIG-L deacetylase family protein, partial [Acidimicrobiales bacterium]